MFRRFFFFIAVLACLHLVCSVASAQQFSFGNPCFERYDGPSAESIKKVPILKPYEGTQARLWEKVEFADITLSTWEKGYFGLGTSIYEAASSTEAVRLADDAGRTLGVSLVLVQVDPKAPAKGQGAKRYAAFFFGRLEESAVLGLLVADLPAGAQQKNNIPSGALAAAVAKGTSADTAGIAKGDLLVAVNGANCTPDNFYSLMKRGDNNVDIIKDGKRTTVVVIMP